MTLIEELVTVFILLLITVSEAGSIHGAEDKMDGQTKAFWTVRMKRTGPARVSLISIIRLGRHPKSEVSLGCDTYSIGNGLFDNLYVNLTTGRRVYLLARVDQERVMVTVIKGSIRIDGVVYKADCKRMIPLTNYDAVWLSDVKLEFVKIKEKPMYPYL